MAEHTAIEWCDATFNPWIGCTKVSPACDDCYAARSTPARTMGIQWGPKELRRRTSISTWRQPVLWNRAADEFQASHGRRRRVFCASLADVFDNGVPPEWRADLFALIDKTPHLDWLLLTKRIGNVPRMLDQVSVDLALRETGAPWSPRPNVWLGATVVNQTEADRDIPKLLAMPARVRFLSIEPMLGPVDVSAYLWPVCGWWKGPHRSYREAKAAGAECGLKRQALVSAERQFVDWVIAGGESGPHARPMHPDWVRSLRDQCDAASVPFLFKQWGEWTAHTVDPCGVAAHLSCIDAAGGECALSRNEGARAKGEPWWHLPAHPGRGTWGQDGIPPGVVEVRHTGKKAAGRLLDGVEHNGFPS